MTNEVNIGLGVKITEAQGRTGAAIPELHAKPAFRDSSVHPNSRQKGIQTGISETPVGGAPGDGEAGAKHGDNVRFASGAKEAPAGGGEGGGPGGVAAPDLLERHNIGACSQPLDNLTN